MKIRAADLFCGAGGASTGLVRACQALGTDLDLLAVNHWPTAVQTHSLNHPGVRHLCESIERVNPRDVVPGGRLHLLLAGPECTHFSTARGGRPVNAQSRASAWNILKWAQELYIDTILIENVPEFRTWGPIGADQKPLKSKKGQTYRAFLLALESLGYRVEDRILNAADFGDPTTRRRLFIIARRGKHPVRWPAPSHSKSGSATLFGTTKKWKAAREVIDWSVPGKSIFNRKKPLRPATMARIFAGLERFGGPDLQPFLVVLRNHAAGRSLDAPLPTVTAGGTHLGLCEPFVLSAGGPKCAARPVSQPLGTILTRDHRALVQPFILQQQSGGAPRSTDDPLPTIATDGAISVVRPFLVPFLGEREGQEPRVRSIDDPMQTVTASNPIGLAEPFLIDARFGRADDARATSIDRPIGTIPGSNRFGLAQPFLTKYTSTGQAYSVDQPIDTITTRDRFGLVQPVIDGYVLDIHFRMLQPHELAAATSFPRSYKFSGTREEVVKQIGNSWPGELSFALNRTVVEDYAPKVRRSAKAVA